MLLAEVPSLRICWPVLLATAECTGRLRGGRSDIDPPVPSLQLGCGALSRLWGEYGGGGVGGALCTRRREPLPSWPAAPARLGLPGNVHTLPGLLAER